MNETEYLPMKVEELSRLTTGLKVKVAGYEGVLVDSLRFDFHSQLHIDTGETVEIITVSNDAPVGVATELAEVQ